jgi:hypothetical protein
MGDKAVMKLKVVRFVYAPPALAIIPETDFEAAVLSRYWESATLSKGMSSNVDKSADGFSYTISFAEKQDGAA